MNTIFYLLIFIISFSKTSYAQRVTRHIYPPVDFYGKVKPIKYECEPMVNQISLLNISTSVSWDKDTTINWYIEEGATKHTGTHVVLSSVDPGQKEIIPVPGIPDHCRAEISFDHIPIHDKKIKN